MGLAPAEAPLLFPWDHHYSLGCALEQTETNSVCQRQRSGGWSSFLQTPSTACSSQTPPLLVAVYKELPLSVN